MIVNVTGATVNVAGAMVVISAVVREMTSGEGEMEW